MTPIDFPGRNVIFAKDQPQYMPLPAHVNRGNDERRLTCCWRLTWRERLAALVRGHIWQQVLTFGQPLQPQLLTTEKPELPR